MAKELGFNYVVGNQRYFIRSADGLRFANADENGRKTTGVDFLKPQSSTSYETGFEYSLASTRINTLFYDMDLAGEIYYDGVANANVNLDRSNRKGFQLEADHSVSDMLTLGGGYSVTKAKYISGNHSGNTIPGVAKQTVSAYMNLRLSNYISLYLDAIYLGERYPESDDNNNSDKLGGYTLTNLNLSWDNTLLDVDFRVNNLGNKKYSSYLSSTGGYPSPERNYKVTLSYDFY